LNFAVLPWLDSGGSRFRRADDATQEAGMRPYLLLIPALVCALPAAADELPTRKPGLWEIKMTIRGRELPMGNVQQCTDAETDALMTSSIVNMAGSECTKPTITHIGATYTVDSTCRIGPAATATRAVIAGDFDSAYTVTVSSEPGTTRMAMEAKWIGPCKHGQRPGDIIMPGGIRINVRELAIRPGAAKP
jgi:hypothetical protein